MIETPNAGSPREAVDALLTRLGRIQASAETLRAVTDHTDGTGSPSLPALLQALDRDLVLASRAIERVSASLR